MNAGYGASASAYTMGSSSHPVDVQFPPAGSRNRLYAVPALGFGIKYVMLIPHIIVLYILHIIAAVVSLVAWIPVLMTGRYPDWGHTIVGGTLSYTIRVSGFLLGLSDKYPAFSLTDPGDPTESHMLLQPAPTARKLYAIPIVGAVVKYVMLIPHIIVLYVLGLVAAVALLLAWIPVLLTGNYPQFGITLIGGVLRWSARVYAFALGLTDVYPPFSLS